MTAMAVANLQAKASRRRSLNVRLSPGGQQFARQLDEDLVLVLDSLKRGLDVEFKKEAEKKFEPMHVWLSADEQYLCWDVTSAKAGGDEEPTFQGHQSVALCDVASVECARPESGFPASAPAKGIIRIVLKGKPHAHESTGVDMILSAEDVVNSTHRRWVAGLKKLLIIDHKPAMKLLRRLGASDSE